MGLDRKPGDVSTLANELHHILGSLDPNARLVTSSPNRVEGTGGHTKNAYHTNLFNADLRVEEDKHPI